MGIAVEKQTLAARGIGVDETSDGDDMHRTDSGEGYETCRFEVTSNVVQDGVSWDCMGIVCDRCGYAQMSFTPPKVCPRCKRRVVR